MDGPTLANSKAQWSSALQASLSTFRTLCSHAQATSKSWRPVLPVPGASGSSGSGTLGASTSTLTPGSAIAGPSTGSVRKVPSPAPGGSLARRSATPKRGSMPVFPASVSYDSGFPAPPRVDMATASSSTALSSAAQPQPQSQSQPQPQAPVQSAGPFVLHPLDPASVVVHRRSGGKALGMPSSADIFRATAELHFDGTPDLDVFKGTLANPECRSSWDRMVEDAELIELLEPQTRISKTNFKLGWPASPRDAIAISQMLSDETTLLDVSTSLPRSPDAPAYLRPAPPYVRSHVNLFAWCVQLSGGGGDAAASSLSTSDPARSIASSASGGERQTLRVTLFWSWDLRGAWLGMPAGGLGGQLPTLLSSLVEHVRTSASRIPHLNDYGTAIEVLSRAFDPSRDTLVTAYQVLPEDDEAQHAQEEAEKDPERLERLRSRRALLTSAEWSLPAEEGWDVRVDVKALALAPGSSSEWAATAFRRTNAGTGASASQVILRLKHSKLTGSDESVRVQVSAQRIAASSEVRLRLNDEPFGIEEVEAGLEPRPPIATLLGVPGSPAALLDDGASISGVSIRSVSSRASAASLRETSDAQQPQRTGTPQLGAQRPPPDRSVALASLVRRNYIYFTSLLQEPEAKWKQISDSRGVTVTQLDSIDPTLVVYRAEATFVGVGVWDLFSTISTPGAQMHWDKSIEDAQLLEDAGDASRLWWTKTKAAWPVSARDAVTVETSYKSPASVHVFSFSTDDRAFFPSIPAPAPGTIRTKVDLRGWSVEALSPTTVHITLIEQSDPGGWTSKSAIPALMTAAVAGVGDFAIKNGGPPIATRLLGARTKVARYESDKAVYRLEYELNPASAPAGGGGETSSLSYSNNVECELRCDVETWSNSLDLVVDPPPINVSCLRRHKLSQGGSGLWLTIEHVPASLEDDVARVTVRKLVSTKEKGVVLVNGARLKVDVDELKEGEAAMLRDRKRTKPRRIPLDLATTRGPLKSDGTSAASSADASSAGGLLARVGSPPPLEAADGVTARAERPEGSTPTANDFFSDERPRQPMTCALDVLFLLRRIHAERSPDPAGTPAGWALVATRGGLYVRRKQMQSISSTVVVQRGDKVVEGLTAEDICNAVSTLSCRTQWDERIDTATQLESYGNGATTGFLTTKGAFPFRGRAFTLASITARSTPAAADGTSSDVAASSGLSPAVYFHAAASFPERHATFPMSKLNPAALPMGRVLIDGWILETLDPYSSTLNYPIPSTRCTHVVAVDYAGSLPTAVNTLWNANLPRSILAVEEYIKTRGAIPAVRAPPGCMQVLGDGRDEDTGLVWDYDDPRGARNCTLLKSAFSPGDRVLDVLVKLDAEPERRKPAAAAEGEGAAAPGGIPFPSSGRQPAISNASTTKGAAQTALSTMPAFGDTLTAAASTSISRATSVSSIRSTGSFVTPTASVLRTVRPSAIRAETRKPRDVTLIDVEVELRHYAKGYEVVVTSEFGLEPPVTPPQSDQEKGAQDAQLQDGESKDAAPAAQAAASEASRAPLSLEGARDGAKDLPHLVTSYDLPPSAVLAATLDPSARPRRHLVRIALPTASFLEGHRGFLSGSAPTESPQWYHDLRRRGALLRVRIRPLGAEASLPTSPQMGSSSGEATPNPEDIDSQQVPAHCDGKRLEVVHVNQTSAMLQRESEREVKYAQLERVPASRKHKTPTSATPASPSTDDRLPAQLKRAVAATLSLKADPEPRKASVATAASDVGTEQHSEGHDAKNGPPTPTAHASKSVAKPKVPEQTSTSAQLMGILNAYPLSRLGASTAVTTTNASGGILSKRGGSVSTTSGDASDGSKSKSATAGAAGGNASSSAASLGADAASATAAALGSIPGSMSALSSNANTTASAAVRALFAKQFGFATLVLAVLIAFLFGSLVRALLSPADFILTSPQYYGGAGGGSSDASGEAAALEIRRMLDAQHAGALASDSVAWRELRRLIEIRGAIAGRWDLVLAVVRR